LANAVTVAIERVRALDKERKEVLRLKQIENALRIAGILKEARSKARAARCDLENHMWEHDCGPKR
jgi:hypothetical protein